MISQSIKILETLQGMPAIAKNRVYDKIPINEEEYKLMISTLEERKDYLGLAYVATMFNVGCRRAELIQFKSEIVNYEIPENQKYVLSHIVRGKGASIDGKSIRYMINLDVYIILNYGLKIVAMNMNIYLQ